LEIDHNRKGLRGASPFEISISTLRFLTSDPLSVLLNSFYFRIRPLIPRPMRLGLRRTLALRKLERVRGVWPIMPGSEVPPTGWPGWPEGKQFAFVLSHDVESQRGLERVKQLADLEMSLGFRSSFNFVPEGPYSVSPALRSWLVDHGFEVGIHDLHHDGRLFASRVSFRRKAERINSYLREWNTVGFRSAFMLRRSEWLHDLDIQYDSSTFDTDPFEPQPDGVNTIFPFWVPAPRAQAGSREHGARGANSSLSAAPGSPLSAGYIELPYTLPQDSTLFLILREKTNKIWRKKLDWVAKHGGMVSLATHPDYMYFAGHAQAVQFPAGLYEDFLREVRLRYAGKYWHALPRQVAEFVIRSTPTQDASGQRAAGDIHDARTPAKIWIDLDNTPHVPFFKPLIRELDSRGHRVVLTARDAFQVCELATQADLRLHCERDLP
jgi:hypothetical protein